MQNLSRVLLVAFGFAIGCGDDDTPADGGHTDATMTADADAATPALGALADAWCPRLAEHYCDAAEACGCAAIPELGGRDACLQRAERGCRGQLEGLSGAVAGGALEVAASVPEGCSPAYEAAFASCRMPDPDLIAVACPLVWPSGASRELPGSGAPCFEGLCAEGARCNAAGVCAVPTAGGACSAQEECPAGERCGDEGTCRALRFEGNGVTCGGPSDCEGDLACQASSRRECGPKIAGGACTGDEECVDGEYCDDERCTASPGMGEACGGGVACAGGLACRFSGEGEGTCQALPTSGEPCALGRFGPLVCAEGLACLECEGEPCRDRRCGEPPRDGEACAAGEVRCADGLACQIEGEASVCRPPVAEGAPCGLDASCAAGLYCDFGAGSCAAWLGVGEVCRDGNECGDAGACVPDDAGAFRCVPRPTLGEACFLDTCADGLVCRSPHEAGVCAPPMCAAFPF